MIFVVMYRNQIIQSLYMRQLSPQVDRYITVHVFARVCVCVLKKKKTNPINGGE